ncbi:MAG: sulfatase-like hydrolase/transferase [Planctomycetota bacterium]|nr:sulfatase-like hydrolase/transferase [Planctomycetota bacterium]
MDRRTFLQAGAAGAAASLAGSLAQAAEVTAAKPAASDAAAASKERAAKPNIIWVFGDQHRAQALSSAGDPNLSTPNLDRMAAEGDNFTDAVSGFPLCCPFRGSLLASRYPHVCVTGHEYPLPPGTPTIVQPLKEAGYHTGYFGKWHLDGFHERDGRGAMHIVPPERRFGFDVWVGYENNNSQYDSWVHGGEGASAFHYRLPGYETDCLTDLLINYVKDRGKEAADGRARPFFAALSVQPPHDPYIAPPEYMARHNPAQMQMRPNVPPVASIQDQARRDYAGACGMIENLDANIGLDAGDGLLRPLLQGAAAEGRAGLGVPPVGRPHGARRQHRPALARRRDPRWLEIRVP